MVRMTMNFPKLQTEYTTDRLILRPFIKNDANGILALDSNPNVLKYLPVALIKTKAEAEKTIHLVQQQYKEFGIGRWAVIEQISGKFIGWCGLKFEQSPDGFKTNYMDIGYRFVEDAWGKGYGYESAKKWLDIGFIHMQLDQICGSAVSDNIASVKILKKIGLFQKAVFSYKSFKNCLWFELNSSDYHQ